MTRARAIAWSVACVVFALACGGGEASSAGGGLSAAPASAQPLPGNASPEAKIVDAYLTLQERLAADDSKGAKAAFGSLVQRASALTSEHVTKLEVAATAGAAAVNIEAQRKAFDPASEAAIALVKASGNPLAIALRLAHCPMAFDNKGARWLQRSDKIANPYFGASMLTCGSIDATIQPGRKS